MLGLPGESGGADVDRLYERRGSSGQLALEQVTAGVDVQTDRLVYVVLGFTAQNAIAQVVHFGVVVGDPRDDHVWDTLTAELDTHRTPLPVFGRICGQRFFDRHRQGSVWPAPMVDSHDRTRRYGAGDRQTDRKIRPRGPRERRLCELVDWPH